jgi:hypothetical protein
MNVAATMSNKAQVSAIAFLRFFSLSPGNPSGKGNGNAGALSQSD